MSDFNALVTLAVYIEDGHEDKDRTIPVYVALKCTARSLKGFINGPPERCYPPEGAEFQVEDFSIGEKTLTPPEFQRLFGEALMNDMYEEAHNQAQDSGRF